MVQDRLLNIKEASIWASDYTGKKVTTSNISYLIQYGRIRKHGENGNVYVSVNDVFLVANDKYNLYPTISEKAGMKIVNQFKRPVLNRTEKDKGAYAEIIFHLKER